MKRAFFNRSIFFIYTNLNKASLTSIFYDIHYPHSASIIF